MNLQGNHRSASSDSQHPLAPLIALPQWVVVLLAPLPNGKIDKIPVHFSSTHPCNAHDPKNWTTYENARAVASALGAGFGVGFVITDADNAVCIDIDGALQTDGTWSPLALEIIAKLPGSVVELSQSGRGLHLWCLYPKAELPAHRSKDVERHIEAYSRKRFIALGTGHNGKLAPRCDALPAVLAEYFPPIEAAGVDVPDEGPRADWRGPADDTELIARLRRTRSTAAIFGDGSRATFDDLWTCRVEVLAKAYPADPSSSEPFDRSSADAGLAQHLAWGTGCDVARMDLLMRQSGLNRDKYNRPDYLPRTIHNACRRQRDVLQDPPPPPSARDVVREMEALDRDQILAAWVERTAQLPRDAAEQVIEFVHHRTSVGPRALKAALTEHRAKVEREASAQRVAAHAAGRVTMEHQPADSSAQAAELAQLINATAEPGRFVSFAGQLASVTTKPLPHSHLIDSPDAAPPAVPQIEVMDRAGAVEAIERVAVLTTRTASGATRAVGVPDRIVEQLLSVGPRYAPTVAGLVSHPVVLHSGEILAADGLHRSGLFLSGAAMPEARPYTRDEARAAIDRFAGTLLDGFEFATPLDAWAAAAGLVTAIQRPVLDMAPGLAVLAASQSSGKTTLVRRVHLYVTGRDMPASTFPMNNEEEARKRLLATLMVNPAMVCFDNVPDGFTFHSGVLSAAMTSPTVDDRVLGASRVVTVPTTVMFALTGNNVTLGADEVSRWIVTRLAPKTARPQERRFANPDIVGHALRTRAAVLRDVVGLVAGYLVSGERIALASGTRFAAWDRFVRQSIIWAGGPDVAEVFRTNSAESETMRSQRAVVWALAAMPQPFGAGDVVSRATFTDWPHREALREGLEGLRVAKVENSRSVSGALRTLVGRIVEVDGLALRMEEFQDSHTKNWRFRVARV